MALRLELLTRIVRRFARLNKGLAERRRPAMPETKGAAIEVPVHRP